jgi:hypothetical protein
MHKQAVKFILAELSNVRSLDRIVMPSQEESKQGEASSIVRTWASGDDYSEIVV